MNFHKLLFIAYNHPSGNFEASQEDIQMTKQLTEAGKIIGINVYDHIIFSEGVYMSFVKKRMM